MVRKNKDKKQVTETITCDHCRYERPARDAHCHICGWPWPWAVKEKAKAGKAPQ